MSPELSKQSEDVRSHVRHSKDMNPDSKFLTLKWVWCCDGKTYLESCLNFLDFIQIESLLLWCLSFNSWWCFFFFLSCFYLFFICCIFFGGSFKRLSSSANCMNGWFSRILSSVFFPSQSLASLCVCIYFCVCASISTILSATQMLMSARHVPKQSSLSHIKLSP